MKLFNKLLSVFLSFAMSFTVVPVLNGSAAVYAAVYAEDGTVWIDGYGEYSVSTTAREKNRQKSYAVGMVEAELLEALKDCHAHAEDLRADADVIFKAISRNDGAKSMGLGLLGEGMLGAMKRCYMNNKPDTVIEDARVAANWFILEIEENDAPASLGLGMIGSALQDAGCEVDKFEKLSEDIAPVVETFSANGVAKSLNKSMGLGIMGQAMVGAMKRCYMNNKPVSDDLRNTVAWIAGKIVRDGEAAGPGLGKIGAALTDGVGETGKEFRTYLEPVVNAFASEGGAKGNGLSILGQGMVGAIKRCYINNKAIPEKMQEAAKLIVEEIGNDDMKASEGLGKIGAAMMDGIGETGGEFVTYLDPVVTVFSTSRGAARSEGLGIMGQAMVGAIKRCYINGKPIPNDMQNTAEWIMRKILSADAGASVDLGSIGAALMDGIGETGGDYTTYTDPVVEAFSTGGASKSEGLGVLGQGIVGAVKRCYINDKTVPNELKTTAEWIVNQIGENEAGKSTALGEIGKLLMDGIGETGYGLSENGGNYTTYTGPVVAAIASESVSKSEGLSLLGQGIVSATKRCYLNNAEVSEDLQNAATWILAEIQDNGAGKSKALGIVGQSLLENMVDSPALKDDLNVAAAMIVNEIKANPAGKSEGLARVGAWMLTLIKDPQSNLSWQSDSDNLYSQDNDPDVLNEATGKVVDAIEDNSADKVWNTRTDENNNQENWGVAYVGRKLIDNVVKHSDSADALYEAGDLIFQAFADNPASKSEAISRMGESLITEVQRKPAKVNDLCDGAGEIFDAIAANSAEKSMGIAIAGEKLMTSISGLSGNVAGVEALLDSLESSMSSIERFSEKDTKKENENENGGGRTSGGRDDGLSAVTPEPTTASQGFTDGSVTVSPANAAEGETVTLTTAPEAGYRLANLTVKTAGGETVELTNVGNGVYSFLKPADEVVIEATFELIVKPEGNEWYSEGVAYVQSRGIMQGTDKGFEPHATASRTQIAQLLMNLDDTKPKGSTVALSDVAPDDWYAEAVTWMVENGIAKGQGSSFGVNDFISREDLAVMLFNYARFKGYDTTVSGSLEGFPDEAGVNSYAREALQWAVGAGLIGGTTDDAGNTVIDPQGNATRAQIAVIMERFCKTVAK